MNDITLTLTPYEMTIISEALDSHAYWQIAERGDMLPVDSGYVLVEAGDTWEEWSEENGDGWDEDSFDAVQRVYALEAKLSEANKGANNHGS